MKTTEIEQLLRYRHEHDPIAVARKIDLFLPRTESDFVAVKASGKVYEYEIKVTRSDWKAEQRKRRWHVYTESEEVRKYDRVYLRGHKRFVRPDYFYMITPSMLIDPDELPDWCGLMIATEDGRIVIAKKAKQFGEGVPVQKILKCARAMRFRKNAEMPQA